MTGKTYYYLLKRMNHYNFLFIFLIDSGLRTTHPNLHAVVSKHCYQLDCLYYCSQGRLSQIEGVWNKNTKCPHLLAICDCCCFCTRPVKLIMIFLTKHLSVEHYKIAIRLFSFLSLVSKTLSVETSLNKGSGGSSYGKKLLAKYLLVLI